jgi:hypothetical protein
LIRTSANGSPAPQADAGLVLIGAIGDPDPAGLGLPLREGSVAMTDRLPITPMTAPDLDVVLD